MPDSDTRKGMEAIADAKTYGDAITQLAKNPAATTTMLLESVATSLLASAPALVLGPAGAITRSIAQASGSGGTEYASVMTDVLQDAGVDLLDPNAVSDALSNPEIIAQMKEKGAKRGLIVGLFDGLTMGFAGRFLRPAQALIAEGKLAGNAAKKATLAAWGKELAMQAGGGAGGEFLAQKATGENKPSEVLMEGLAELMTAPLEARSNLRESKQLEAAARLKPAESVAERTEPTLEGGVESKAPPQTPTPSTVQQDEAQEVAAIAKELIAQNIPADNAWNIARKRVAQARKERITDKIGRAHV